MSTGMPQWMKSVEQRIAEIDRRLRALVQPEQISVPGASVWGSSATIAVRSGRTVTIFLNVTATGGAGGANVPMTQPLPQGWQPGSTPSGHFFGIDSGTGGAAALYVTPTGQINSVFARGAGTGTLGTITYVARQ